MYGSTLPEELRHHPRGTGGQHQPSLSHRWPGWGSLAKLGQWQSRHARQWDEWHYLEAIFCDIKLYCYIHYKDKLFHILFGLEFDFVISQMEQTTNTLLSM